MRIHLLGALLVLACSTDPKAGDSADPLGDPTAPGPTASDPSDSAEDPGDTDSPDPTGDSGTAPPTGDTSDPPATGDGALAPGFEEDLVDVFGCLGDFFAVSADGTVALAFYGNDLAGAAFVSGQDTTYDLDLAVDGWRVEVRVGTGVGSDLCGGSGSPAIDATYTATSGAAVLDVWPHPNQAEQTEGALSLSGVVLEAPGQAAVTLTSFEVPRMVFGGL